MSDLRAGAARLSVDPPLGVDLVGFLRRWQPASGYGQPLEANVTVFDDGDRRAAVLSLDAPSTIGEYGARIRDRVADAVGCDPSAVVVNSSHTHAAPALPGYIKTGGSTAELRTEEQRYADALVDFCASVATVATRRLRPALAGVGVDHFDGGVNRRQRTEDGDTIMGWNPDGPTDPEVSVLRVDTLEGTPISTLVNYACHPTVVGPLLTDACSDFVAPMRALVRRAIGGECGFLQGCAGDIFPLEAVHEERGPEEVFGRGLAVAALRARERAVTRNLDAVQAPFTSAVQLAVWRRQPATTQPDRRISAHETNLCLPLQDPPTLDEIRALRTELEARLDELQAAGADRGAWNAVWLHVEWARRVEQRVENGTVEREVTSRVQALTIGDLTIVGLPCEPFCEIGIEVKRQLGPGTLVLGYCNDMVGYVPTAKEFAHGGYEPWIAPRHFGKASPFDPGAAQIMIDTATAAAVAARAAS